MGRKGVLYVVRDVVRYGYPDITTVKFVFSDVGNDIVHYYCCQNKPLQR